MRIHHLALRVADPESSAAFYSGVLGLRVLRRVAGADGLRAIWLRAGTTILMLERELRGPGARRGSAHLVALAVEDLRGWRRRLRRAGIPVLDRTGHTLYVADPDGHRVGLTTYPGR
jgi:catechol 2,3-dioxygenase-like lactoylglutathione lyase family enzyme